MEWQLQICDLELGGAAISTISLLQLHTTISSSSASAPSVATTTGGAKTAGATGRGCFLGLPLPLLTGTAGVGGVLSTLTLSPSSPMCTIPLLEGLMRDAALMSSYRRQ